jgi:hypothetical protein
MNTNTACQETANSADALPDANGFPTSQLACRQTGSHRGDGWCRMVKNGEFQKKTVTSRLCTIRHYSSPFITNHHQMLHLTPKSRAVFAAHFTPLTSASVCTNVQKNENEKNDNHALLCTFLHTCAHSCTFLAPFRPFRAEPCTSMHTFR